MAEIVLHLRPGRKEDLAFAKHLYFQSMRPLLEEYQEWNEKHEIKRLTQQFSCGGSYFIGLDGEDVGWLQLIDSRNEMDLSQLYIEPEYRGRGIGTCILEHLFSIAESKYQTITLVVLKNNRAKVLYERCGFKVVGEEGHKLRMRWVGSAQGRINHSAVKLISCLAETRY